MIVVEFIRVVGIMVNYDYIIHECLHDVNKEAKHRNWEDFGSRNSENA